MEYQVLEAKEWVKQEGCYTSRIVLLRINKGEGHEYSTHIQGSHENGRKFLVHGHYFTDIADAVKDFKEREL